METLWRSWAENRPGPVAAAHPVDLPSLRREKDQGVWALHSQDGSVVLALFNLGEAPTTVTVPPDELDAVIDVHVSGAKVTDVITGEPLPVAGAVLTLPLESHASRLLRFAAK